MSLQQSRSNAKPILIFPAGMPRALEYLEKCQRDGQAVVGSSSLMYDTSKTKYPLWAYLPYITDPAFNDALRALILEKDIGGIYTPNPVAWSYLKNALQEINPAIPLVNPSPMQEELSGYRAAIGWADKAQDNALELASSVAAKEKLPAWEIAALFRHANVIPGMCDAEKIAALCEIARHSSTGDVVEIGCAYGKSAFVLARLARCYGIGKTLCVDPWQSAYLVQNDPGGLVDRCSEEYNMDEMLRIFEMNLLPYSANDINYLRLPSTEAAKYYASRTEVHSAAFGSTTYLGRIALLHIDGNHSYEAASADVAAWSEHVLPGGWMVIDDYIWPYGDGPKRAGDEFLFREQERIMSAFVMGTALFLQLS